MEEFSYKVRIADGITGYPSAPFNLMTGATVVFLATIVGFAYRWPKAARMTAGR